MKSNTRRIIVDIVSILLIILLIYASISKLADYTTFKVQLSKSPFIHSFSSVLSWAVPASEILAVMLLISNRTRLIGLYLSLFLMALFSVYIYAMLHYSYYVPCSCGGILSKMDWGEHLVFNLIFLALNVAAVYAEIGIGVNFRLKGFRKSILG